VGRTLTSVRSNLILPALDQHSTSERSYHSHRETSYAVQSNTQMYEHNELILRQKSFCAYEKKSSDIIVVLVNDIICILMYSVTRSDETTYPIRSVMDYLVNLTLLNTTLTNARGNPTYFDLQEYLKSGSRAIIHPCMHLHPILHMLIFICSMLEVFLH
jgi:hypothetical protein